jgi:hypothetical protein
LALFGVWALFKFGWFAAATFTQAAKILNSSGLSLLQPRNIANVAILRQLEPLIYVREWKVLDWKVRNLDRLPTVKVLQLG